MQRTNYSYFVQGANDCLFDEYEFTPFKSTGGMSNRSNMSIPSYMSEQSREDYLAGYISQAKDMYGDDWQTMSFDVPFVCLRSA